MARRYKGKLFFDEVDHLDISALIIRENEIGFSLACVSKATRGSGTVSRWEAESGKVATLQEDGSYLAQGVKASQHGISASNSWDIVFWIGDEEPGVVVEISGELRDAGSFYFEGELEAA